MLPRTLRHRFPNQALWEVGQGSWSEEVGLPEWGHYIWCIRKGTVFRIPHSQIAKAQEPWAKKPVFRGVFRIPEQHENIVGVT